MQVLPRAEQLRVHLKQIGVLAAQHLIQPPELVQLHAVGIAGGGHPRRGLTFLVGDVDQQHRMVGGERAPGFGDQMRLGHVAASALLAQGMHDVPGVIRQVVVHRAVGAGVGAFVVHAQTAAHVHGIQGGAQLAQFHIVAGRFAHARLDVLDVGDLRAQVEMQHAHAVQPARPAAVLHRLDQLRRTETELGLFAAGVLPVALADAHQAHPQTDARRHLKRPRFLQQHGQLGELFHHDLHLEAELLAHQRQAQVFTVLVAVADHHVAGVGERQHRQQLRLGAGLQPHRLALFPGAQNFMHHAPLLVDLDRIHRRVAALVALLPDGAPEGAGQAPHPVAQNAREAGQHRRAQSGGAARLQHRFQGRFTALIALGANMQVAVLADPEIAVTPTLHIVNGVKRALGLGHGRFLGGCVLCRIMPAGAAGGQK